MRTERLKKITIINKILTTAAVFASAVCFLSSCDNSTIYNSFHPIDKTEWDKADGVCFDIIPSHYEGNCESYVVVRTNGKYPYKNLSLFVQSTLNDNVTTNRIDFDLTKYKNDGIRHNDYIMPIREFAVSKDDTIHVRISHNMQTNIIGGITDVGIRLDKK